MAKIIKYAKKSKIYHPRKPLSGITSGVEFSSRLDDLKYITNQEISASRTLDEVFD